MMEIVIKSMIKVRGFLLRSQPIFCFRIVVLVGYKQFMEILWWTCTALLRLKSCDMLVMLLNETKLELCYHPMEYDYIKISRFSRCLHNKLGGYMMTRCQSFVRHLIICSLIVAKEMASDRKSILHKNLSFFISGWVYHLCYQFIWEQSIDNTTITTLVMMMTTMMMMIEVPLSIVKAKTLPSSWLLLSLGYLPSHISSAVFFTRIAIINWIFTFYLNRWWRLIICF